MLTIADTPMTSEELTRFERALPRPEFIATASLAHAARLAADGVINALVVTDEVLRERGYARLSWLKAGHPEIAVLAYVESPADGVQIGFALGRAHCDAIVRRGVDDGREQLRDAVALAALRSVADAVQGASAPTPSILTAANLERVLRTIHRIHSVSGLATALGVSRAALRVELRRSGSFPPRRFLAWLRLLVAARRLGDTPDSAERIGLGVGYSSGPAFHGACRRQVGATPRDIRERGGLRYAVEQYRAALATWRLAHLR